MKRHLYYDQQLPQEDLPDAAHASTRQSAFARYAPTREDVFFFEWEQRELGNLEVVESQSSASQIRPVFADSNGVLERISRAMTRGIDWNWQF